MSRAILVSCGSFSPITFAHLRMFEMARDHLGRNNFSVISGIISPVSDHYKKEGLISSHHRINMCKRACTTSDWITTNVKEANAPTYTRTVKVLENMKKMYAKNDPDVRVFLLAGTDLVESFNTPGLWSDVDISTIKNEYGLVVIEREGKTGANSGNTSGDFVYSVSQIVKNDISSTKVRGMVRDGYSVKYLVPDAVIKYIEEFSLY